MSDLRTHNVLVDSVGWEGRRDELAEAIAAWIGLPTARVRATLAVRDQPVATFETEDEALRLVAELDQMGVRARVRRGARRSLADLTRRRTPGDAEPPLEPADTVQPGWSHAFDERQRARGMSDAGTVIGMPGTERADELQQTMLATPSAPRMPGTPTSGHTPPPRAPRDANGVREAAVSTAATTPDAAPADSAPEAPLAETMAREPGGWSAILGARLGEKLVAAPEGERAASSPAPKAPDEPTPGSAGSPPRAAALGPNESQPEPPPPPVARDRNTRDAPAIGVTMVHGPGAHPEPPEPVADEMNRGAEPLPGVAPVDEIPAQFERVRPLAEADAPPPQPPLRLPRVPEPSRAFWWGIAAPGAGQAYLGDASSGVTYALGSFAMYPWFRGAYEARRQALRITAGNTLPLRETNPTRTLAYVASYWAVVGVLVLGIVALRGNFEPATLPPIDEAAIEARAMEQRRAVLAAEAEQQQEAERIARAEEAARAEEERARMVELLRDARSACEQERYLACRELAQMALEIDGTNREGHWLRARAINEGRELPDGGGEPDPGPTPAEVPR